MATTKKNGNETVASTKSAGKVMMAALRKKGSLTTEQLTEITGLSVKDTFSRAWWLSKKEGLLKSTGHGKSRLWQLSAKGVKSVAPPAGA